MVVELVVCGYPRSGNCWLARLLGEALDVKVVGISGGRGSIAAEGFDRKGKGYVKQAHLWPGKEGHLRVDLDKQGQEQYILMIRDPRDVAVSIAAYWNRTLDAALDWMIEGPGPLELPPWAVFVDAWLAHGPYAIVRYEDLHRDARGTLEGILEHRWHTPLDEVIAHQAFHAKKHEMRRRGNAYPFGRRAQLAHLRKGNTGEWKEVFSGDQAQRAQSTWEPFLHRFGYDTNSV